MAFKKKMKFGNTDIDCIAVLKKINLGSKLSPITAELQIISDLESYNQYKNEERGFKLDENGDPVRGEDGEIIGLTRTLKYEDILLKTEKLNSRTLGQEKDKELRDKILKLLYEYFAEGKEEI